MMGSEIALMLRFSYPTLLATCCPTRNSIERLHGVLDRPSAGLLVRDGSRDSAAELSVADRLEAYD